MSNCMRYTLPQPYPPVCDIVPNPNTARLLMLDYAGVASELTAITQYLFQSVCAAKQGAQELSEMLECLSMTEMHHLKLLGKTIAALGVQPRYLSYYRGRPQWWSADMPPYETNLGRMLASDLTSEKNAVHAYRQRLNQTNDPAVRRILERILADEEHHVQLLSASSHLSEK